MKQTNNLKWMAVACSVSILCNGCASMSPATRAQVATQSGAFIGSGFGAAIGDNINGDRGSFWGSLIGGVAGMAIGAAAASAYDKQQEAAANNAPRHISRANYLQGASLTVNDIMLHDRNGNQCIDAGEDCQISFIIENVGNRPAYDVCPTLKAKRNGKRILLSPPKRIERIEADQRIGYTVQARGTEKLKTGQAEFIIQLEDGSGQVFCEEAFSVNTFGK